MAHVGIGSNMMGVIVPSVTAGAMFLAYLTIIPTMTVFLISIETRFFDRYVRFYRQIENHATPAQIARDHQEILRACWARARAA